MKTIAIITTDFASIYHLPNATKIIALEKIKMAPANAKHATIIAIINSQSNVVCRSVLFLCIRAHLNKFGFALCIFIKAKAIDIANAVIPIHVVICSQSINSH